MGVMYSGTTLRNSSGRIIGAHQKLDRVARRAVHQLAPDSVFPTIKEILHFEGLNGPDGIKRKSPARDEPWHYYDPTDPEDTQLIEMIQRHTLNLTAALKAGEMEKAAFEAAWMAHAITDGLTPAHHYPLEKKLEELRGEGLETRTSYKDKLVIRSAEDSRLQVLAKNWEFWGAKGVMTTHLMFELGFAAAIAPLRLKRGYPSEEDVHELEETDIITVFKRTAQHLHDLKMYERFAEKGWNGRLAREAKQELAPAIVRVITLAWYDCVRKAGV